MSKHQEVDKLRERLDLVSFPRPLWNGQAYVLLMNTGRYYEAHDVVEDVWLQEDKNSFEWKTMKGMIQVAGGFVHLKLNYENPNHIIHQARILPAMRLFKNGLSLLCMDEVLGIHVQSVRNLAQRVLSQLKPNHNTWSCCEEWQL